jgi:hypothetical protein
MPSSADRQLSNDHCLHPMVTPYRPGEMPEPALRSGSASERSGSHLLTCPGILQILRLQSEAG